MTEQQRKEAIKYIEGQLENGYVDLGFHEHDELEIIGEAINLLKTVDKFNSIDCTSFQMSPNENVEYGRWIYWDGWIGNSCQRIDDAVCSNCGYKHPTVYWTKGDEHNSTPNKLADICPNCKAVMNKWSGR